MCYCNDVLDLDIDGISTAMTGALWQVRDLPQAAPAALCCAHHATTVQGLVEPLMAALRDDPDVDAAAAASGLTVKPAAALYVLSRLCHLLTYRPLLTALTDALLSVPSGAGAENRQRHSILRMLAARDDRGDAVGALCLLCVLATSRYADDATLGVRPCKLRQLRAETDTPVLHRRRRRCRPAASAATHKAAPYGSADCFAAGEGTAHS